VQNDDVFLRGKFCIAHLTRGAVYRNVQVTATFEATQLKKENLVFGIGLPELSIILIIVLVIFGAGKLPSIGAGIGNGIRNFKTAVNDVENKPEKIDGGKTG
jgi:sec-independent protein translocase protein TatA